MLQGMLSYWRKSWTAFPSTLPTSTCSMRTRNTSVAHMVFWVKMMKGTKLGLIQIHWWVLILDTTNNFGTLWQALVDIFEQNFRTLRQQKLKNTKDSCHLSLLRWHFHLDQTLVWACYILSLYNLPLSLQAVTKVKAALHGHQNSRWNDLEMMTEFTHTGEIGEFVLLFIGLYKCWPFRCRSRRQNGEF
jgi:hypothetical protein